MNGQSDESRKDEKERQANCEHDYRMMPGGDVFRCTKCGKLE